MPEQEILVGKSRIGRGLFAGGDIAPDDLVARVSGDVVADPDYGSPYCIDLGDGTVLEPHQPFCFLNHSCRPNCELIIWEATDEPPDLCLHAVSPIRRNEELTIDYAWPAESAIPCHCQAERCRGWIVGRDQLPLLLNEKSPKAG